MPRLEEPKKEVFSGRDIQISGILFNPWVTDRRLRNSKPVGREAGVGE